MVKFDNLRLQKKNSFDEDQEKKKHLLVLTFVLF